MSEQWIVDLDGVVWLGMEPIAGAAAALDRLRASGRQVAFFTNNSYPTRAELLAKFESFGVQCADEELLSSPDAAASLCKPGERALCLGGLGIVEALNRRGVETIRAAEATGAEIVDVVVVGFDPEFDFLRLRAAARAVLGGARLIGTNDDATYPMVDGPVPGGGSLLAAVAYATSSTPQVAGKPNDASIALIKERLGPVDVAVGDRLSTDGELAERLGARFGLVLTGVTKASDRPFVPEPAMVADDLASLVDAAVSKDS